jgi:hypothetical protein
MSTWTVREPEQIGDAQEMHIAGRRVTVRCNRQTRRKES